MKALDISNVISLVGGVALFLFGMALMGEGLKKVAGNKLELILYRLSNTPVKGVLLGAAVTAVIQSSSATSVMVVGFVNSGMMKVNQAIGIILGAILGTSVTGWIICLSDISGSGWISLLSTSTLTGLIAVIGIVLRMSSKKQSRLHVANIILGFAVLMYGMQIMSSAVSPLRESEVFINLITTLSNPILGILVGAAFTSVIQSASAAVGILQALSMTGAVSFSSAPMAMPMVIGSVFYALNAAIGFEIMDVTMTTVTTALLNTLFRLAIVIILTPFIGLMEKMICALIPDRSSSSEDSADIDRLEERFIAHPALALEQSRLAVNSMARKAQENLEDAFGLLGVYSEQGFARVEELEDVIDRYEDKLGTYLIKITAAELTPKQTEDASKYLHTISDFERISDHAMNIAETAQEIYEKGIHFSDAAMNELEVISTAVTEIVALAMDAFTENNIELAYRVEPLEELIDTLCDEMKLHHVERLQNGVCTLNQGFVFNDLLTNYERVGDHCSNIAVAMIELESEAFDTHEYLNSLRKMHSERFDRYFDEYSKRFHI